MQRSGTSPQDIANLIFTSCSAPLVPALDVPVMQQLQFPPTVARVPMYQHGCVGGAVGLSLANKLVAASNKPAAVVSVELCSLIHQGSDLSRASFAGSAIFGDGAGCAIVSPDSGLLRFVASTSFLVPDTAHLIGYHIRDDGTHLMLEKEVALSLIDAVPGVVAEFLDQQQIATTDIDAWLLHPGSAKIIESLQSALAIDSEKCRWSWEILTEQGNMSSASLFFVLERFLRDLAQTTRNQAPFKRALMLGVGPGVALELILFENVV